MEGRSSSKPEVPILTKAQQVVNKADEAKLARKYEQAVELYRQAAELYLHATNYTSDLDSMKHLQQLSDSCTGKATELEKHIRILSEQQQKYHSNSIGKNRSPVGSPEGRVIDITPLHNQHPHSISPSSNYSNPNPTLSSSPYDNQLNQNQTVSSLSPPAPSSVSAEPLYGSQNFFIGQESPSLSERKMDEIVLAYPPRLKKASDSVATIQIQNESSPNPTIRQYGFDIPLGDVNINKLQKDMKGITQPNYYFSEMMNGVDVWGWMEKMIDILPKPIVNMALPHKKHEVISNEGLNHSDNSLMNSFYLVSSSPTLNSSGSLYHSNYHGTAKSELSSPDETTELERLQKENAELKMDIQKLISENQNLRIACEKGLQVSKENDLMKRSIIMFREEFKKRTSQIRELELSNSVGGNPKNFKYLQTQSTPFI